MTGPGPPQATSGERDTRAAVWNGLRNRCPACGKGKLYGRYLKVNDTCPNCGEDLYHQRADDGPAFITMCVVLFFVAIALALTAGLMMEHPLWVALGLCAISGALALFVLPRVKGLMVGVQWAKRMHGFDQSRS